MEEGAFIFDVFPWREETFPRAQTEALISWKLCAGDTGSVWVIFFNAGSIVCTSTAGNKEELLYLKTLRARLSMKNESESVITAWYIWTYWLLNPANVLCLHGCILTSLWKGAAQKGLRPEKPVKELPRVWLNLERNTRAIWQISAEVISTVPCASLCHTLGPS